MQSCSENILTSQMHVVFYSEEKKGNYTRLLWYEGS